jgi:hypothetical protein
MAKATAKQKGKVEKVMKEYKSGKLKSGKKGPGKGPVVKSRKQAVAIAMSEAGMAKKKKK